MISTVQNTQPICEFHNISKSFSGIQVLKAVSFSLRAGSVHGLLGENGAGKSTLMKILSGDYQADDGVLKIAGNACYFNNTRDAKHAGVAIVHQELQLIPHLSVGENILLGRFPSYLGIIHYRNLFRQVQQRLDHMGIAIDARTKVDQLLSGQKQLVEIAKAIMSDAQIIVLDEPTSSLSTQESNLLFRLIHQLRHEGKTLIYISHRLDEIFALCQRATILRDGQVVENLDALDNVTRNDLVKYMVGRNIEDIWGWQPRAQGEVCLSVDSIQTPYHPAGVSFKLRRGEILGFFGLVGSGRSELMRALYGDIPIKSGEVHLEGQQVCFKHPALAIRAGVVLLTEERKTDGIVQGRSIEENMTLSARRHFSACWIHTQCEAELTDHYIEKLNIKTSGRRQDISLLSGGNQQKVLLSRWLAEPDIKVMMIDEPTRGIDVGAKADIYKILYRLAEKGMAIIVVSSELPEVMGISDRLIVMCEGQISHTFTRDHYNEANILDAAFPQHINT